MNENDTRALVERFLAAFNASNYEGMLACLSEDVAHDAPGTDREIGREKFRWRLAEMARHFEARLDDIAIMTAPGGLRAAAEFTLRGTYNSTMEGWPEARGQAFQLPTGLFLDIDDDGLISRVTGYYDPAALRRHLESS